MNKKEFIKTYLSYIDYETNPNENIATEFIKDLKSLIKSAVKEDRKKRFNNKNDVIGL